VLHKRKETFFYLDWEVFGAGGSASFGFLLRFWKLRNIDDGLGFFLTNGFFAAVVKDFGILSKGRWVDALAGAGLGHVLGLSRLHGQLL